MEYDDYEEYDRYEPTEIKGLEEAVKIEAHATIDVESMRVLIRQYIQDNYQGVIQNMIQKEVIACLKSAYNSKARFNDVLKKVIEDRFDKKYPKLVDGKIDEFAKKIQTFEFDWQNSREKDSIKKKAVDMVNGYIDRELAAEVKKSTDYLEQYSRNYFANNLFRAMGMMDKLLPKADFDDSRNP